MGHDAAAGAQRFTHKCIGTCAKEVSFVIDDGKVFGVSFVDGCEGNHNGIAALAEGMDASAISAKLLGTPCGRRKTSCPDQLARGISNALQTLQTT